MAEHELIQAAGIEVPISNPQKVFFPELGVTKLDLVNYYLAVADAAVRHLRDRPTVLKRFADGAAAKPFFQKRIPDSAPEWLQTTTVHFPSGRSARELLPNDAAHLVWGVNLGVIDWNPWQVRLPDLDHPDELRVDLDPTPEASWDDVRQVALVAGAVLRDHGLTGYPKTSGSRGIHINVRIRPEHDFVTVRRAAVALAREVERRAPEIATQQVVEGGAPRRVRRLQPEPARPDGRLGLQRAAHPRCPRLDAAGLGRGGRRRARPTLRIDTVPARLAEHGDPSADIDAHAGSLDALLALAQRDEDAGLPDAPWPPHFKKQQGEPPRVAPSRAKRQPSRAGRADHVRAGAQDCICASAQSRGGLSSRQRRISRPVADAAVAGVVEGDLDHQLGTQLDPLEVLLALPAAGIAVAASAGLVRGQAVDQGALLGRPQARGVPDDVQPSRRGHRARGSASRPCPPPCRGGSRRRRRRSSARA